MATFQTISQYLDAPFGNVNEAEKRKMEEMYKRMSGTKKIRIEGYTKIDDNYLWHIIIPSESNANQSYDVVLLFFTDDASVKRDIRLNRYYIKFFSNSPSFIYQYAAMYHEAGYLVDFLFEKMDKDYKDVMPKKPKPLSYDKSLYCACRYLMDNTQALSKLGMVLKKKKTSNAFFRDIKTFQDVKLTSELNTLDKKLDKELEENKKAKKNKKKEKRSGVIEPKGKKIAKTNTLPPDVKPAITHAKHITVKKAGNRTKSAHRK